MIHDVVVVGAGPAGCHAASLLALKGLDVYVLEEHPVIGEPVDCSGVIGADAFVGLGLPEELKRGQIDTLTLVSPAKLEVRFFPSSPLAYIVDRAAFDRAVAQRTSRAGAVLHLGARVADIGLLDNCVELTVYERFGERVSAGDKSQAKPSVQAKVVILASGPRYKFQQKLGMGQPANYLKTAQAEVPVRGIEEARVLLGSQIAPSSFAWIVPLSTGNGQMARIGVSAKGNPVAYLKSLLQRLFAEGYLRSLEAPIRSWVIPISPLPKTFADRALAVGDAAGQTKPTTGGGIYYSLLCAEAAAKTVATAFEKGDFGAKTLSNYEYEWRKKLGREIRIGKFFRRLVERLTDQEIDDLFRVVLSDGVLEGVARKARFDWHRDVIRFALTHPGLGKIFLRGLFR